ncbi:hypothetical protein CPLU01_11806 [Colletotrichum plurivorum]|uniref:Uncharacterized protein n=1 Tax=Colletotrichum plurivorum TaxID=2175906 RepID=A0A8H6N7Y7_9PEZI|nr:hypothetical protein CPLU01_11806 [Colletotrichum plurivorum]
MPDSLPRPPGATELPALPNKVAVADAGVADIGVSSDTPIAGVLVGVSVAPAARIRVDVDDVLDEVVDEVVDEVRASVGRDRSLNVVVGKTGEPVLDGRLDVVLRSTPPASRLLLLPRPPLLFRQARFSVAPAPQYLPLAQHTLPAGMQPVPQTTLPGLHCPLLPGFLHVSFCEQTSPASQYPPPEQHTAPTGMHPSLQPTFPEEHSRTEPEQVLPIGQHPVAVQ